jgi:hypothetical protein
VALASSQIARGVGYQQLSWQKGELSEWDRDVAAAHAGSVCAMPIRQPTQARIGEEGEYRRSGRLACSGRGIRNGPQFVRRLIRKQQAVLVRANADYNTGSLPGLTLGRYIESRNKAAALSQI